MEKEILEHRQKLIMVASAAALIADIDIPEMLEKMNTAESVGSILNPTLWIQKNEQMKQDAEMLQAALPLWKIGQKLKQMVEEKTKTAMEEFQDARGEEDDGIIPMGLG